MGGNIFKDEATSIRLEDIQPTISAYIDFLGNLFPMKAEAFKNFVPVGSVGKKPVSGDLDLAIDLSHVIESFTGDELKKWDIDWDEWNELYLGIHKRSRTATYEMSKMKALLSIIRSKIHEAGIETSTMVTAGNIFTCFPQYGPDGNPNGSKVQIDWMVGDEEWLTWAYHSTSDKNLKGLHRTQFLVASLAEAGYTFNHFSGIKKQGTSEWTVTKPDQAVDLLSTCYQKLTIEETYSFHDLNKWLKNSTTDQQYSAVIKRYKRIIRFAKADLPSELDNYDCY